MAEENDRHDEDEHESDELSLEDLGAAYARVAAQHDLEISQTDKPDASTNAAAAAVDSTISEDQPGSRGQAPIQSVTEPHDEVVTPEAIIEAALFVGHPDNKSLTEQRLASLMRGVTPNEVVELIDQLNESYQSADQALRIVRDEHGFRMTIAAEVEHIRRSFLGKVREARLSQMAIEVLALVAYQPGITAQRVQDQRGRESNSLLNQLVRRQLLRMERIKPESGGRAVPHYFPTDRFLDVFGLESLEDLPHVEEEMTDLGGMTNVSANSGVQRPTQRE